MVYNNIRYVTEFGDKLYKYWKRLQKRYNVDVPLIICDSITYTKYCIQSLVISDAMGRDNTIELLNTIRINQRPAAETKILFGMSTEDNVPIITSLDQVVVIQENVLFLLMLENIMQLDKLYEYYRIALRHEMGHVLDHINSFEIYDKTELMDRLRENSNNYEFAMSLANTVKDRDEYIKLYSNIPLEKRTNDIVNLTIGDFKRAEKIFNNQYDFEINYTDSGNGIY